MKTQGYKHLGGLKSELEYSTHLSLGWKMLLLFQTQGLKDNRSTLTLVIAGECLVGWLFLVSLVVVFLDVLFHYS